MLKSESQGLGSSQGLLCWTGKNPKPWARAWPAWWRDRWPGSLGYQLLKVGFDICRSDCIIFSPGKGGEPGALSGCQPGETRSRTGERGERQMEEEVGREVHRLAPQAGERETERPTPECMP